MSDFLPSKYKEWIFNKSEKDIYPLYEKKFSKVSPVIDARFVYYENDKEIFRENIITGIYEFFFTNYDNVVVNDLYSNGQCFLTLYDLNYTNIWSK